MEKDKPILEREQELEDAIIRFMTNGRCLSIQDAGTVLQELAHNAVGYLCRMEKKMYRWTNRECKTDHDRRCHSVMRADMERSVSRYAARNIGCGCSFGYRPDRVQIRLHLKCEATGGFSNIEGEDVSGITWIH